MPLLSGRSQKAISQNIRTMMHEGGRKRDQIIAIAMRKAGRPMMTGRTRKKEGK